MKIFKIVFLALTVALLLCSQSMAMYIADITYDYTDNGGGNYTFDYTVSNKSTGTSSGGLDYFLIIYDADASGTYSSISWVDDNGWTSFAGSGLSLADDSILFGSGGGGIAQGASLGGFQVNFNYSGAFAPEDQLFSWFTEFGTSDVDNGGINKGGYWILGEDSGTTAPVPEPGTLLLLTSGLFGLYATKRKLKL